MNTCYHSSTVYSTKNACVFLLLSTLVTACEIIENELCPVNAIIDLIFVNKRPIDVLLYTM